MSQKIICFHNPNEINGIFSNWYLSNFAESGLVFTSAEQYMMYHKALTFHDDRMAEAILNTEDVAKIKQYGRQVANYDDTVWSAVRYNVVRQAVYLKFTQNKQLYYLLKTTGDDILCECAVHDRVWGIGLSMTDPKRFDPKKWRGMNLLGKALMDVRAML